MSHNSPDNFHVLRERLRLQGTIELQTALHIGAAPTEYDASDMPVLRDHSGRPLIPGASLKGVCRSTAESLIRAVQTARLWACNPLRKHDEAGDKTDRPACGSHGNEGREKAVERIKDSCAVCRLFGSHVLMSHVRFSDALLINHPDDTPLPVELRDGVAINRDLKKVHGGQKYDFDVVSPGTQFNFEVFVENPEPWLMGVLMLTFDQLDLGFTAVGGFSSRGLGRIGLKIDSLTRVTALSLFEGNEPEEVTGEAFTKLRTEWRDALAAEVS